MKFSDLDLLLVHAFATCAMTGLILFVQVVHYPLFARIGPREFQAYHERHAGWTAVVVTPLMGIELLTAARIAIAPPSGIDRSWAMFGLIAVGILWLTTAAISVPLHARLGVGRSDRAIAWLVATNWIRTVLWSGRSLLVLCFVRDHVTAR